VNKKPTVFCPCLISCYVFNFRCQAQEPIHKLTPKNNGVKIVGAIVLNETGSLNGKEINKDMVNGITVDITTADIRDMFGLIQRNK